MIGFVLPALLPALLAGLQPGALPPGALDWLVAGPYEVNVPRGTETLNLAGGTLTVTPRAHLAKRALRMPVTLHATVDVTVWGCVDHACVAREDVHVPAHTTVVTDLPVWGEAVRLRARSGTSEVTCCRQPELAVEPVWVVANGAHIASVKHEPTGVAFEAIGALVQERPELLDAVDALVIVDEALAPDQAVLSAFVRRGGQVFRHAGMDVGALQVAESVRVGAGSQVTLTGQIDARALSALVRQQMSTGAPVSTGLVYTPDAQLVQGAVGAALHARPGFGFIALIALAGVVAALTALPALRRGAWRAGLVRVAAAFAVSGAAMVLLKPLLVPAVLRTRMIAWVGPATAFEVGADGVRPRSGTELFTMETPHPIFAVGLPSGYSRQDTTVTVTADRHRATAPARADTGVFAMWSARNKDAGKVAVRNGRLHNDLGEPIAFVVRAEGTELGGTVAPGASIDEPNALRSNGWAAMQGYGVTRAEERLLREVMAGCRGTSQGRCAAALVRRPDATLAIEVRGW